MDKLKDIFRIEADTIVEMYDNTIGEESVVYGLDQVKNLQHFTIKLVRELSTCILTVNNRLVNYSFHITNRKYEENKNQLENYFSELNETGNFDNLFEKQTNYLNKIISDYKNYQTTVNLINEYFKY